MNVRLEAVEKAKKYLKKTQIGVERETLRVTEKGMLAKTKHPSTLGSKLKHPSITNDFAEAQLELITEPYTSLKTVEEHLKELHLVAHGEIGSELLWPLSMPSTLPRTVPIADFGASEEGKLKTLYRKGLVHRYGQNMQLISGIHYNISYDDAFFRSLHTSFKSTLSEEAFRSETYLHIARNVLRYGWIITYLYGASPTCADSFGAKGLHKFGPKTRYLPHATSLRMSNHGYYSRIQQQLGISYNSKDAFIETMQHALTTKSPSYARIKEQLNSNILQYEGEWYTRVRPKPSLETLQTKGIEYLELRSIDIDPFHPLGIGRCQMQFLELFLLFCLVKKSPPLTESEIKTLCKNQNDVALHGRHPGVHIMEGRVLKPIGQVAKTLIRALEKMSHLLPVCDIESFFAAVDDPEKTLSGKIMQVMQEENHTHESFGLKQASEHRAFYEKKVLPKAVQKEYKEIAEESVLEERLQIQNESVGLFGYEDLELSTQVVLRAARDNTIGFRVIDRKENLVEFSDGKKRVLVKQATKTNLDSYLDIEIMGSKALSKRMLQRAGFSVPDGATVYSFEDGMREAAQFFGKGTVIKPNETNFGTAVHIFEKLTPKDAEKALKDAFLHDKTVLIEPFIKGKEYRFLIINRECVGIVEREPAHIVGDGIHSVAKLVNKKNANPLSIRSTKEQLQLGLTEKRMLKEAGLSTTSIIKKGEKVYLRSNSNFSTGGDTHDRTDDVHSYYKEIACQIADFHEVTFCGVDMIIPNHKRKGPYAVIETNFNPMLSLHAYPTTGKGRPVGEKTLRALGFRI